MGILLLQSSRPGKASVGVPFSQLSRFWWFFGLPQLPFLQSGAFCCGSSPHLCSPAASWKGVFCVPWRVTGSLGCRIEGQESFTATWGGRGAHICPHGPGLHAGISPSAPTGEEVLRACHDSDYLRGLPPCLCNNVYVLLMGII